MEVSNLRQSLEIARQQQLRNEETIVLLRTQLNEMTSRSEDLYERAEDLNQEVDKLQFTCDTLRAENRKLTGQIKMVSPIRDEAVVTRTDIERDQYKQQLVQDEQRRSTQSSILYHQRSNVTNSVVDEEARSEQFESVNNSWDNQSIGSATPSIVSQARQLANMVSTNRVNTGRATSQKPSQSRNKHPTPAFFGTTKPSAQEWLSQFRKVVIYHQYSDEVCIAEFMMAMQGHANSWWEAQTQAVKTDFEKLIDAFEKFYGGSKASMARAIATLKTLTQNKKAMATFGPRLMNLITTVASGNAELQLSFFYAAVDSKVADAVLATRPNSLVDAVNVAIELEQGMLYKASTSGGRSTVIPKVDGSPMTADNTGVEPMDVDVNAQYRHHKSGSRDKKSTVMKCHVCDKPNHVMKDCFLLRDAKALAKERQDKKVNSNDKGKKSKEDVKNSHTQQAFAIPSKDLNPEKDESDNLDTDITNNFYNLLYQNSQTFMDPTDQDELIPSIAGGMNDGTNFILEASVTIPSSGEVRKTNELVDTGTNISTITRQEAERLSLEFTEAAPLRIVYGNASSGLSKLAKHKI
ncbi:hypothetical protein INT47_009268 [Mucor saturninus]|uniref:Uncharacterized protein n=1 Tax=Mucor saturninus TaxID=64648 RepID=A0A8H7UZJ4_9FUNG|nr:hypothetical protein INT47_009268 [Mucor saturninus]